MNNGPNFQIWSFSLCAETSHVPFMLTRPAAPDVGPKGIADTLVRMLLYILDQNHFEPQNEPSPDIGKPMQQPTSTPPTQTRKR